MNRKTDTEWCSALQKLSEDSDEMLKTYKSHDLNKDGRVSSPEYLESIKIMQAKAEAEHEKKIKDEL